MSVFQSVLLGVLQGIAEFLPISSSGHLNVVQHLFGLDEVPLLFDVMLHLATLAAVVIFFRKTILKLLVIFFRWIARKPARDFDDKSDSLSGCDKRGRKTIVAVILTTIVTGLLGVITSKLIPDLSVKVTCAGFIITAFLLIFSSIAEKKASLKNKSAPQDETKTVSPLQALFIGLMQGIGTLPGISRSGSTIAGAQLCGVSRSVAGEYSFIASIPAILGAFVLELKDLSEVAGTVGAGAVIAGCVAAFIFGYASLAVLMKLIKRGKLEYFAIYLIPVGIAGMLFLR